jgi:hypothetical protein
MAITELINISRFGVEFTVTKELWLRRGGILDPRRKGTFSIGSHYQKTGREISDRKISVRTEVNCKMCIVNGVTVNVN